MGRSPAARSPTCRHGTVVLTLPPLPLTQTPNPHRCRPLRQAARPDADHAAAATRRDRLLAQTLIPPTPLPPGWMQKENGGRMGEEERENG
uniref:Uncharacterized protein n=1 Tax=Oryza rufipogon TaxID=4529 RepID=A0A2I4S617_ORYRU|nr:hypothetical protein DX_16 [Oryza rufipogon]